MNAAHLRALLDALGKLPRPSWPHVLNYIHTYAHAGILRCSINALLLDAPGRPALTGIKDKKLSEALWALRNLQLVQFEILPSRTSRMPETVFRVPDLLDLHVQELVFVLERISDKPRTAVQKVFCRCLEQSEMDGAWSDVAPLIVGERFGLRELIRPEFLVPKRQAQKSKLDTTLVSSLKLDTTPPLGGTQSHFGDLVPAGLDTGVQSAGSTRCPVSGSAVDRIVRDVSTTTAHGPDRAGLESGEGDQMTKQTLDDRLKDGTIQYGSKPLPKTKRRPEKKRKTVTTRLQHLRNWDQWKTTQPALDKIFPAPCITLTPEGDVDYETSNPDAIKLIEFLQKGCNDLLKHRIGPYEVPSLLLQAWRAYARLFNLQYSGPGDMRMIPPLRVAFRRMTAGQTRMTKGEILSKMAGFVFRMDNLRRNRKGEYFPNQEWIAIYSPTSKYGTAWQDALLSDSRITAPMPYMLSVEPFVKPTTPEGLEVEPPPATKAERLAAIRERFRQTDASQTKIAAGVGMLGGDRRWDKLTVEEKMLKALGSDVVAELKMLEKEIEGDPANQAVPQ